MQSDPTVETRGFPSRDGGFRSPASDVGVLKTPIARRANQRQMTQTVAAETLARTVVGPASLKRGTTQQQQQQQQQQTTMLKSRAALNSTDAGATAAVADGGGVLARTVVINSSSSTGRKVVKADVAFNRRGTGGAATKGITVQQSLHATSTAAATGSIGLVRGGKVDHEVRGTRRC